MKITLRGKNIEITEAIEEKVSEKLSKLDKYFIVSENVEAKVLVRTYPYGQKIEVTIPTEYVLLRAEVVDQDLYNAIDLVIDKLEGQIRKYKTRLNRKSKDNKLAFNLASIEPLEDEEEDVLVKTKTITPKPMDMEEAIMQMELIGQHCILVSLPSETVVISLYDQSNIFYKHLLFQNQNLLCCFYTKICSLFLFFCVLSHQILLSSLKTDSDIFLLHFHSYKHSTQSQLQFQKQFYQISFLHLLLVLLFFESLCFEI